MRHAAGRKKVARPGWPPSGPPSDAPRARGFFLLPAAGRVVGVLDAARGAPRRREASERKELAPGARARLQLLGGGGLVSN